MTRRSRAMWSTGSAASRYPTSWPRGRRSLGDDHRAAAGGDRRHHGQRHHERDLSDSGADPRHQHVSHEHAHGHARDEFDHPGQPLAETYAERDQRRDRREERLLVPDQRAGG
ncbi:MAG TPA: hypothetical protein VK585_04715, partial [Jiangellaceae bacterium]|nr:hypothetical protein [Jiangellaceae bacterium]